MDTFYYPDPTALNTDQRTAIQNTITAIDKALDAIKATVDPAILDTYDGFDPATDLAPLMDARGYLFEALGEEWDPLTPDWNEEGAHTTHFNATDPNIWYEGDAPRTDEERRMLVTMQSERDVDTATHAVDGVSPMMQGRTIETETQDAAEIQRIIDKAIAERESRNYSDADLWEGGSGHPFGANGR